MKMNNIFIKLLVSLLIILTLVNFISSIDAKMNYSLAGNESEERVASQTDGLWGTIGKVLADFFKGLILAPFRAARSINYWLASSGGVQNGAVHTTIGVIDDGEISPFDIFFNRFTLLDANIFSTTDRDGNPLDTDSIVYKIRSSAAIWYYAIRTLAIGVIAIMLLWNLIRSISKTTSAEQKSVAKNSLTDWVLSFALIMFMHIIVIIVLNFNDLILVGIQNFTPYANTKDFFDALENAVFNTNFVLSVTALVVYALLNFQTLKYILVYIQRLLVIVLLIMISPIIPITYSTDRMRGGKGLALNGWLKELLFNVFLQPLHAIVYAALVGVSMASLGSASSITGVGDLGNALVAIASMLFIKYAEKMVKTIFGFDTSQVINKNVFADAATTIATVSNSVRSYAQGAAMGGNGMVSFGQNVGGVPGVGGIGFGQNVGGLGAGTGMNLNGGSPLAGLQSGIRQSGNALMNGIGTIGEGMAGDGTLLGGIVNVATGEMNPAEGQNLLRLGSGSDEENGSAYVEAEATATAEAEATAQNGEDGKDGISSVISVEGSGDGGEDLNHEKKQDDKQRQMSYELRQIDETSDERLTDQEKKMNALESAVKSTQETKENNTNTVEKTKEKEHIEEVEKVEEENHTEESSEVIDAERTDEGNPELMDKIKQEFGSDLQPELIDKVGQVLDSNVKPEILDAIKAIIEDNTDVLEGICNNLNEKLDNLKNDIGEDEANEIEENVNNTWNKPEELKKYISTLPEGSKAREYAETYARLSTMMSIGNKDMSNTEKLQTLVKTEDAIGNVKAKNQSVNSNVANTETSRMEEIPEVEDMSEFEVIEDDNLRGTMEELATLYPDKYIVKGRLEGKNKTQIENELDAQIVEEFSSTMEEFTEKMGREPKGIKDIYKNMDEKARQQFANYKTGRLSAKDLDGDAKALAALEIQARRMNYNMTVDKDPIVQQVSTKVEYKIGTNGGTRTATMDNLNPVIIDLQAERERQKERRKQKLA